jgi:hypothetical protein
MREQCARRVEVVTDGIGRDGSLRIKLKIAIKFSVAKKITLQREKDNKHDRTVRKIRTKKERIKKLVVRM